jgi:hypothetical protein
MEIKTKLLVLLALSGVIFLLFAGSASAAVDFPADEAGICAYVKAKASIPNLNVVKPCFATIERETSDYIIGTVAMSYHTEEEYPHVYVSTDGWVVAYYPNDRSSGWLLPWYYYSGGAISTTTLKEAVAKVIDCTGGDMTDLKYYDFRHPNATKMMIIVENVGADSTNYFKVRIPSNYTTYRVDWSHRALIDTAGSDYSYATLDGATFSSSSSTRSLYGSFDRSAQFPNDIEHTILIGAYNYDATRVGLVLEYAE